MNNLNVTIEYNFFRYNFQFFWKQMIFHESWFFPGEKNVAFQLKKGKELVKKPFLKKKCKNIDELSFYVEAHKKATAFGVS